MAVLCEKLNLLYIEMPRTGCTAVANFFREFHEASRIETEVIERHVSLTEFQELFPLDASSFVKVVGVRNPFDSLVSQYHKIKDFYSLGKSQWMFQFDDLVRLAKWAGETNPSFDEVLFHPDAERWMCLDQDIANEVVAGDYDFLMRFESLNHEMDNLTDQLGSKKKWPLQRYNTTKKRNSLSNYRDYYTTTSRDMTHKRYHAYLQATGYKF